MEIAVIKRLKPFLIFLSFLSFALLTQWGSVLWAKKLDWSGGYFKLNSQTANAKSSIGNLGAFQISYRFSLLNNVEFGIGYSLIFSKFFSGDYGYGPDMGLYYFPFTSASTIKIQTDNIKMESQTVWRPFAVIQFHSRQYQSIEASYAGFSFGGGIEYWNYYPLGIRVWGKHLLLKGPQLSTATEQTVMAGFSWEY